MDAAAITERSQRRRQEIGLSVWGWRSKIGELRTLSVNGKVESRRVADDVCSQCSATCRARRCNTAIVHCNGDARCELQQAEVSYSGTGLKGQTDECTTVTKSDARGIDILGPQLNVLLPFLAGKIVSEFKKLCTTTSTRRRHCHAKELNVYGRREGDENIDKRRRGCQAIGNRW